MTYKKLLNWKTALATAALLIIGGVVLFANSNAYAASNATYIWRSLVWVNSTSFKATLTDGSTTKTLTFTLTGGAGSHNTGVYKATAYKGCQEQFRVTYNSSAASWQAAVNPPDCAHSSFNTFGTTQGTLGGVPKAPKPPGNGGGNGCTPNSKVPACTPKGGSNGGSTKTTAPDTSTPELACSVSILNPITWIICPLVAAAQQAVNHLQSGIDSLLTVKTSAIFSTSSKTGAGFYQAWNSFRLFAVGIIIIAGLIMIISQAAGMEVFDAYTVRKVLPRLLVAIIFISLSWPVLEFLINLSNDLGIGVRQLIYTPFINTFSKDTVSLGGGTTAVAALIGSTALLSLGLIALGSFVITALLAVFVGFVILLLRQMVIMLLVIMAPLAIACYVMPNTQKVWGFWKDTFISMLVVFPIISGFIAMGRVFAVVMYNNPSTLGVPDIITQIGALIAFFLPYFMLPFAFRMAGGAVANLAGIVNDKGRGGFDRLKGFRQKRAAAIWEDRGQRARSDNLFRGENKLSKGLSHAAFGVTNAKQMGVRPSKWKDKYGTADRINAVQNAQKTRQENAGFLDISQDNEALTALEMRSNGASNKAIQDQVSGMNSAYSDDSAFSSLMTKVNSVARSGDSKSMAIAASVQNAATGTGFGNELYKEDVIENGQVVHQAGDVKDATGAAKMAEAFNRTAAGDQAMLAQMTGMMRPEAQRAGRFDLAGGSFSSTFKEIQKGSAANGQAIALDAFMNNSASTIMNGKKQSTDVIASAVGREMSKLNANQGSAQGNVEFAKHFDDFAAGLINAQRSGVYTSPQAVSIINNTVKTSSPSVQEEISKLSERN